MKKIYFLISLAAVLIFSGCDHRTQGKQDLSTVTDSLNANEAKGQKIIAATVYIRPEKIEEFKELFKELLGKTLNEAGCISYQLYQNPFDNTNFMVFETFKDQKSYDLHFSKDYFQNFIQQVRPFKSQSSEIRIYDVTGEVRKLIVVVDSKNC